MLIYIKYPPAETLANSKIGHNVIKSVYKYIVGSDLNPNCLKTSVTKGCNNNFPFNSNYSIPTKCNNIDGLFVAQAKCQISSSYSYNYSYQLLSNYNNTISETYYSINGSKISEKELESSVEYFSKDNSLENYISFLGGKNAMSSLLPVLLLILQ